MLALQELGKNYGARSLFAGVSLQLNRGCRYGLVGANGSGKTTLLRILVGDEEPSDGAVIVPKGTQLGVLRQDRFLDQEQSILDVAMQGDDEVWRLMQRRDALVALGDDAGELASVEEHIGRCDGYTLESRAGAVLQGLGIPVSAHRNRLGTLSGGYQLRVLLAQVLLGRPDVLLLDEPTNHLDILSIRWLEKYIAAYEGTVVVISHDARFLDHVTTHTLDIDYGVVTLYAGNWSKAMAAKELARAQKEAAIDNITAQIEHKQAFIDRFGAKNTKATQAASRKKQIERLSAELDDLPPSSRRAPLFRFVVARPSGKEVLELKKLGMSYGDKRVLHELSLSVARGERVAVIGENGLGKSTLLKLVAGRLSPTEGSLRLGHEVQPGFFAQDHKEILDDERDTPLSWLDRKTGDKGIAFTRGQLGRVLFSGDDVKKAVVALSGGEAARLVFCGLAVDQPNLLLLDEPTNHLDIEAIDALIAALLAYDGTLIFVSHDRYFVDALATRVIELRRDGVTDFRGTFAEYLAAQHDDHLDGAAVAARARQDRLAEQSDAGTTAAQVVEEQKKKKNRQKELEKRRDQLLADIDRRETEKRALETRWTEDGFFERTSADEVRRQQAAVDALAQTIGELVARWEEVELELAD
ncbi:MAG: ABC-F family ATP-binding cassette domain-containing protein [Deltaproteobacteria bacterium]|nr:ABC-F family ATP-binding cassette domain-containing protein [Deltaproteobacteria bacterium]